MKKGFTLLEMLIVIGIVAVLVAATLGGYQHVLQSGEQRRAQELVSNVATALTTYFQREGSWPKEIRSRKSSGDLLDEKVAWYLRKDFTVTVASDADDDTTESGKRVTSGLDRFGIVTPWATSKLKNMKKTDVLSKSADAISMPDGAKVSDHIVRFAVDLDGDGLIENVVIGGDRRGSKSTTISVRATAIAWCCGRDGRIQSYSAGLKKGGIYSWSYGQTVKTR